MENINRASRNSIPDKVNGKNTISSGAQTNVNNIVGKSISFSDSTVYFLTVNAFFFFGKNDRIEQYTENVQKTVNVSVSNVCVKLNMRKFIASSDTCV